MAFTVTPTVNNFPAGVENTQHLITLRGTLAVSAGTYVTGGAVISWLTALDAGAKKVLPFVQGAYLNPIQVSFLSAGVAGTTTGGFIYTWNAATNSFQISAAATVVAGTGPVSQEMTNGTTIPTAVTGDTILFEAIFVRSYS